MFTASGKFHDNEDKNYDIQPHYMNNITAPPHCEVGISACGKLGSMDGTEGFIELYDGQTKIFKLFWSDPFVGGNDFQIQDHEIDGRYHIDVHPWNHDDGALGRVNVEVFKRG
ncbi:uncharacterized protein EAE98_003219 [Botrytis deweyae]|uniref:Uncharacterized protein n=1 Tax=Botrytis deweyae TaxID=2478750 RepID=A0ABQ7ISW0_9HELO|nr:uncharacterized protein EAE98_003219 [Botrytis deweyae]KAF7933510.1 hypothetical protein EAE98_003219 [Botrytis deweyae]